MLDSDLLLGDCFTYRTASDQPSRWTVCVRREPPTAEELRLLGNIRFSSIVTDSGARPPKRPYGMIRGPYGGGGGGHGSPTGPHAFKRSRKESGSRAGAHDQNQPVASLERDGEAGETRSSAPQDRISSVLVEDSQKQRSSTPRAPSEADIYTQEMSLTTRRSRFKHRTQTVLPLHPSSLELMGHRLRKTAPMAQLLLAMMLQQMIHHLRLNRRV